ncbi:ACT domain-containing protein [Scheffersomyces amazonensis]|uniref:ACT domain-containing protein n=1 Tax=Scheffersomyces amazonensis TaxID=1078765 RepID=UPI00315D2CF5
MKTYFKNPIKICQELNYDDVKVIDQNFLSLQVDSDGSFDNSLRILELTKPLSENNISLFFLSSHFSDIVLIPYIFKEKVISILTKKNFEFSDISNSYIMTPNDLIDPSMLNDSDEDKELGSQRFENKTFKLFKDSNIKPIVNRNVKLLLTGARAGEVNNTILKTAKILSSFNSIPDYYAITRTSINEVSLILPKSSKKRLSMGFDSKNIIGSTQDIIIPITIDFSKLPLDSTGIVAGVASKLINGLKKYNDSTIEMNYFSMARSGMIMIPKENIDVISEILNNIDYDIPIDSLTI